MEVAFSLPAEAVNPALDRVLADRRRTRVRPVPSIAAPPDWRGSASPDLPEERNPTLGRRRLRRPCVEACTSRNFALRQRFWRPPRGQSRHPAAAPS
jgi:hypothetical protein